MSLPKKNIWRNLVAQDRVKKILSAAFSSGNLGHAYLFCGEQGSGKFAAALDLAMAILCKDKEVAPCNSCQSCIKALNASHPDFRVVFPVILDDSHKSGGELNQKGWDFIASLIPEKIKNPYSPISYDNKKLDKSALHKAPSIPVEWIKEANNGILRGSVESDYNVTIICDVDTMNIYSANAMLKTLEEPPQNSFIFLTTSNIGSVLPTIISRCQIVRFGILSEDEISKKLSEITNKPQDDIVITNTVKFSLGSLGRALSLINIEEKNNNEENFNNSLEKAKEFWKICLNGDWLKITSYIDELADNKNYIAHENFFRAMLYLIRNSFIYANSLSKNYFDEKNILENSLDLFCDTYKTQNLTNAFNIALNSLKKNGNVYIIMANLSFSIMENFNVKK
jgi:DNA polymerase-3 subunit delta'